MVKLALNYRGDAPRHTMHEAVATALRTVQSQLDAKRLLVVIELDADVSDAGCPQGIDMALRQLLSVAIDQSPRQGELQISACRTVRGVEIEIADCSQHVLLQHNNAFTPCDHRYFPRAEYLRGWTTAFDLYCTRCPQGGVAWTIVLPRSRAATRAA